MFNPRRCLIVGPAWVGDMMMAQSLFIALKQRYPLLIIDVLAPAWSLALLAVMPQVNQAIELPFKHGELNLKRRYQMGKALSTQHYDWSIVLPNSLKSALIPFWARIARRTGFIGEMRYGLLNDPRKLDKLKLPMTVQRFVALAHSKNQYSPPFEFSPPSIELSEAQLAQVSECFNIQRTQPLLVLCPGAEYGDAKRWPAHYFATVAAHMLDKGWQVVLLGSSKDDAICQIITEHVHTGAIQNLAGQTSLLQALTLLALATKVVSNDSGLMHMAAAVNTPVVAVYGSSDPTFTPPLSSSAQIIYLGLECSPCFKRQCPLGHLNCLTQILPTQVLSHLS